MPSAHRPSDALVSLVVPVLDEEGSVEELARRAREALRLAGVRFEIVFVDDGSRDGTAERIRALRAADPAVKAVHFTRRFGHQAALAAGLEFARGDAVVTMDGDLQHPPELLPELIEAWRGGADVVQAVRRDDGASEGPWKRTSSRAFYRTLRALSGISVTPGAADFRLLDRRAVDAFRELPERFVFLRGLVPWLGFSEARVEYRAGDRFSGRPKYGIARMLRLALDGVFSFSVLPLRAITLLGLVTSLFGLCFGVFGIGAWLAGRVVPGWASVVVLVLLFGGVQLLSIGIVSEYVGRIYEETKRRPRYVVDWTEGIEPK